MVGVARARVLAASALVSRVGGVHRHGESRHLAAWSAPAIHRSRGDQLRSRALEGAGDRRSGPRARRSHGSAPTNAEPDPRRRRGSGSTLGDRPRARSGRAARRRPSAPRAAPRRRRARPLERAARRRRRCVGRVALDNAPDRDRGDRTSPRRGRGLDLVPVRAARRSHSPEPRARARHRRYARRCRRARRASPLRRRGLRRLHRGPPPVAAPSRNTVLRDRPSGPHPAGIRGAPPRPGTHRLRHHGTLVRGKRAPRPLSRARRPPGARLSPSGAFGGGNPEARLVPMFAAIEDADAATAVLHVSRISLSEGRQAA